MIATLADNSAARLALFAIIFIAVAAIAFAIATAAARRGLVERRLADPGGASSRPEGRQLPSGSLRATETHGAWLRLVNVIEKSGIPLVDTKDSGLRNRLIAAGYPQPQAPQLYSFVRLTLVVVLPVLTLAYLWLSGSRPGLFKLYFLMLLAAVCALYLPSLFLKAMAARRERELINGFPDALDLMLVCVEAGLGLEAAFSRVGAEMTRSHPLLAEQFGTVVLELRAGRSREDALRRMADRSGADEIRAFATLLIQSTKLGSSISQTLRVYANEMRERRRMRAEEKAHRLPVLLSIPLVVCMLPVMIGVLMLPAVIRTLRVLIPALAGQSPG